MPKLTHYHSIAALILITGWSAASFVYLKTGNIDENPFEEFENSKRFLNSVERMGGKTAILANDMGKWFSALWQGPQLAVTIAVITVLLAGGYYFIATGMETDAKENNAKQDM